MSAIIWKSAGSWTLGSAVYYPTSSQWLPCSSYDSSLSAALGTTWMNSSGAIVIPSTTVANTTYDVTFIYSASDFTNYSGSGTITATYTPASTTSPTVGTANSYTLGQITLSSTVVTAQATIHNRVLCSAGDKITISFSGFSTTTAQMQPTAQTLLRITDATTDSSSLCYFGNSGSPPLLGTVPTKSIMQYATVNSSGKATFILTQCGNANGIPILNGLISAYPIPISSTTVSSAVKVNVASWDPWTTSNPQTLTCNVISAVTLTVLGATAAFTPSGTVVCARIDGY